MASNKQSRRIKTLYAQRTREKIFSKTNRSRAFAIFDEGLWGIIARLKMDKYYPRKIAVWATRKKGQTQVWTTFDRKTKTLYINKILLDSCQQNAESFRRVKRMIEQSEKDARAIGAIKIETDFTIVPPNIAKRFGFTLKEKAGITTPLYKYKKRF